MAIRRVVLPAKRAVSLAPLSPCLSPFRVVLPIVSGAFWVLVCLVDVPLVAADEFTLTFTGDLSGTGSMITDGICFTCTKTAGLLSLTINLGSFSGASAFDIVDDDLGFGGPAYNRSSNSLDAPLWDLSESPGAQLVISSQGSWEESAFVGGQFLGTYAISPAIAAVPEPNTFALLVTAVGLLGFMIRGKTHFVCAIKDTGEPRRRDHQTPLLPSDTISGGGARSPSTRALQNGLLTSRISARLMPASRSARSSSEASMARSCCRSRQTGRSSALEAD